MRSDLPGANLVSKGISDLARGRPTKEALLVSIGAPRLRAAGLKVPRAIRNAEHRLYDFLASRHGNDAHSQYNALIRRLVSFERALECVKKPTRGRSAS